MSDTAPLEATIHHLPLREPPPLEERSPVLRAAEILSVAIVVLIAGVSIAGLAIHDLYRETAWAREAFHGGDLITLVVATPLLAVSLALAHRGSAPATAVWIG